MNAVAKNWLWFVVLMALVLGVGLYLGNQRRKELGKSFEYSLDDYRQVDPALVKYKEVDPIVPTIGNISALAIAPDGKVYVGGEGEVEIFPSGRKVLIDAGAPPSCLAVDEAGDIYVGYPKFIHVFWNGGNDKHLWVPPGGKAHLTSIAVDDWYVYVADAGSRRIWRYNKEGGEPFEIGEKDWANGVRGFFIPSPFFDLAISRADGSLWAVNPGHHALENYRPDGMPLSKWETSGMRIEGFSGCCNPSHFALMPDGSFVTAEKGLPRIKIHNLDGSLRCVVAVPDQFEDGATGLDVAVDDEGKIYVLDPSRNQVRVFEEIK